MHRYDKMLLDPVMIAKDGKLANNADVLTSREPGKGYTLVRRPRGD